MSNSAIKDVFSILESFGAELSPHLVHILKICGYNSIRAICKIIIDKIKSIETFIRELFSDKSQVDDSCIKDEKVSKFGPLFWNNPDKFTFTLGNIDSIQAAVVVCIKISDGETLPIRKLPQATIFESKPKKSPRRNTALNQIKNAKTILNTDATSSQTETEPSQLKNLPKKRKSVLSLISAWVEKHKEVNFVSSNWSFNEKKCVVTCGQCKSDIGISVNKESGQ